MKQLYSEAKNCTGCGACAAVCPREAVTLREDREGFLYPHVEETACIDCGLCARVCPANGEPPIREGRAWAIRCRDGELLKRSASGGAFSLLAEAVLNRGGTVCGAVFDGAFQVRHILGREIAPMRKSKYIQSDMTGCFRAVRQALEAGTDVLFTGTPCQCHGLQSYLGKKPPGLYLASLVCRGAASPGLWRDYIQWLVKNGRLERFDFRDKRQDNSGHTVSYTVDGVETAVSMHRDGFTRLYNLRLTYRPSCYVCPYCRPDNGFDFTLGDFWGVEKFAPSMADGKGVSLVITHRAEAEALLDLIRDRAEVLACSREDILQPSLLAPAREPLLRRFLFRDYAKKDEAGRCDMALILKKYAGPF